MRALVPRLRLLVAVLAVVLGAGSGLPGLVGALAGAGDHVCTCGTGGDHAACPVCNPGLAEAPRFGAPAARAVPCGTARFAVFASGEMSTLPLAAKVGARVVSRAAVDRRAAPAHSALSDEPATPPPRAATT